MSTNDKTGGPRGGDISPDSSPPSSRLTLPTSNRATLPPPSAPPSSRAPGPLSMRSGGLLPKSPTVPPPSGRPSVIPPPSTRSQAPISSPPSSISSMNKAILALDKVKAKLEAVERQKSEPIAVIAVACRFPGGGDTPEAFFRFLKEGGDAITQVPADRWRLDASEDATSTPEGRATRWGGFLRESVDRFDARFFGISPREAVHLDPQQRLLLELGWEALERAGQDPVRLVGSATGVFLGISNNDYIELCKAAGPEGEDVYAATGNGHAFAAGRLSYVFGFQGPSLTVDTLCSSSLVAVHLACQSLRNGEAALALAGGVNLMLSPDTTRLTATTQGLSPDGRCKTFDAAANGFVRGEGCGMVVLKLLSDAQRDGDPILALIRGSAVNQDGRSTGLTTPNGLSQQAMLRQAFASARVAPEEVGYIETHGTGTSLGDPIEFEALHAVVGEPRPDGATCVLGAVKSNIGHLESAAGVAGLIKVVMALREEIIPRNLHFRALNPRMSLDGTPFVIPTENLAWPRGEKPRLVGVSSFGMSGTNAHLVLEEPPAPEPADAPPPEASSTLLPISAKSPEALRALAQSYAEVLSETEGARLSDLAYTASVRRAHHEHRLACTGRTQEEIADALAGFVRDGVARGIVQGRAATTGRPRVVYVFSGQGSQWVGMGRQLLAEEPVFRSKLEQCSEILRRYVSWTLLDELQAPAERSRLTETKVVQPALFAIQVALVKLLKTWGVPADAVIGHSVGEVAAAHVAGVLPLDEAARLVAWRGRIMQKATGYGKMVWIALPAEEAARAIAGREAVLSIGAINDPGSVVLSGDTAAIDDVVARLTQRGVQSRVLRVNYAFHSPQMTPLAKELEAALGRIKPKHGTLPIYSTVTGAVIDGEQLDSAYWARNVREPVQFARAVAAAFGDGNRLFLEIGPHPVLSTNLAQCFASQKEEGIVAFTLRREADERRSMLEALGTLYTRGIDPNWKAVQAAEARFVPLPTYPWQRERYWVEAPAATTTRVGEATGHPLLGVRVPAAGMGAVFETELALNGHPWLGDHRVAGQVLLPGAAMAELVRAASAHGAAGNSRVMGLVLQAPLVLLETEARRVQVVLSTVVGEATTAAVYSQPAENRPGAAWTLHATATVSSGDEAAQPAVVDLAALRGRCTDALDVSAVYSRLAEVGLAYGPTFRGLRSLWQGEGESVAEVALPASVVAHGYGVHPALLDAAFHAVVAAVPAGESSEGELLLPFEMGSVAVYHPGVEVAWVHARVRGGTGRVGVTADVTLVDASGVVLAEVSELRLQRADRAALGRVRTETLVETFYRLDWREVPLPEGAGPSLQGRWVVVAAADSAAAAALATRLGSVVVTQPSGLGAALARASSIAGVVCLWERGTKEDTVSTAQRVAAEGLLVVQALLGRGPVHLVWVTTGTVAVEPGDAVEVSTAPVWGLARTVMQEHPELGCRLLNLEPGTEALTALERELGASDGENQVAWRGGRRRVARLVRGDASPAVPDSEDYQLQTRRKGTLDALYLAPAERRAPASGEVQIEVRASGLNFRDVLNALGMYPGEAGALGVECSGVVIGVGPGVDGLSVGDAVMALAPGSFRRFVTLDARLVAPIPTGLSFEQAAAVPVVFLTAWYALHDLGNLHAGERLLVHAAAGGVGMAAVQLARWIGAEVYATASPSKWEVVRALGVAHVANSRTLEFAVAFREASAGCGMDVVLNALAGEFVDASLSLLRPGGRLLEMGKTDVRDPAAVAGAHPGVRYQAFDMWDAGPDRIQQMLAAIGAGFAAGHLRPLPVRAFPVTEAEMVFRFMGQARHVGKIVLVPPRPSRLRSDGTVVLTGGLGALGLHVARWLAREGVRHLVLTGRRGRDTPGAADAVAELEALGVHVTVASVDVADRAALESVLHAIPAEWPLRGVVHAAGVLDDGILAEQTTARFARVLSPKVSGGWNLHELTLGHDLDIFVMFSSMSGLLGGAGQGNYAAANTFLDALAAHRRGQGLQAQSLAWGPWSEGGMAAGLAAVQQARLARQGMKALSAAQGILALEQALARPDAVLGVVSLDLQALIQALGAVVPPVWRALVRAPVVRAARAAQATWAEQIAALPPARRTDDVRAAVQADIARVLSLNAPSAVPDDRPLSELGLDSLMAVELRNALGKRLGATLPATLAFDYPTLSGMTKYLLEMVLARHPEARPAEAPQLTDVEIREAMASISVTALRQSDLLSKLLQLAGQSAAPLSQDGGRTVSIDDMDAEELIRMFGSNDGIADRGEARDE